MNYPFAATYLPAAPPTVAYVGTYPPQECGIATFMMDLVNATDISGWRSVAVAVGADGTLGPPPDSKVIYTINRDDRRDYVGAARCVAGLGAHLMCVQHEYGIFGGDHGDYVLDLVRAAPMPVIVTLHTILPKPPESLRRIVCEMAPHVARFVVMAHKGAEQLRTDYGIPGHKIHFIPHGAPDVPLQAEKAAKCTFGLKGRRVLSTFGLVAPSKGIEDVISALPAVVEKEPSVVYLILGATHPVVKRKEGEAYREGLTAQAAALGLTEHVRFVDQYLSLPELIGYLLATDVYVTPYYANPYQITSGTLAYALAMGRVIVSTPYLYAEELLAEGRGFLYPFRDTEALSAVLARLLSEDGLIEQTRRCAYDGGRAMTWPRVGVQYVRLFQDVLRTRGVSLPPESEAFAASGLAATAQELLESARPVKPG
jgi:glycosyltransferase involved in cell wall biosynthesis